MGFRNDGTCRDEWSFTVDELPSDLARPHFPWSRLEPREIEGYRHCRSSATPSFECRRWRRRCQPGSRRFRVWTAPANPSILVAAFGEVSAPVRLSESEFRATQEATDRGYGTPEWFERCLRFPDERELRFSAYACRLSRHWERTLSLLRGDREQFYPLEATDDPPEPSVPRFDSREIEALVLRATRLREEGNKHEEIRTWARLVEGATGDDAVRAVSALADGLDRLGENYLATAMLRVAIARSRPIHDDLVSVLAKREAPFGVKHRMALSYALGEGVTLDRILACAEVLGAQHNWRSTIDLCTLLPDRVDASEIVRPAFLAEGWWDAFEQTLVHLPADERSYWSARRSLSEFRFEDAEDQLELAGRFGEGWLDALREAWRIRRQLVSTDPRLRRWGIERWIAWERDHPGEREWRSEPGAVRSSSGILSVRSLSSGRRTTWFRVRADAPATVTVAARQRVRFELRAIANAGTEIPDTWLEVGSDETVRKIPLDLNGFSDALAVDGLPGARVGRATTVDNRAPAGRSDRAVHRRRSAPSRVS